MSAKRTYDRTWEDIEAMLGRAERKMNEWKGWFEECRQRGDRSLAYSIARRRKFLFCLHTSVVDCSKALASIAREAVD